MTDLYDEGHCSYSGYNKSWKISNAPFKIPRRVEVNYKIYIIILNEIYIVRSLTNIFYYSTGQYTVEYICNNTIPSITMHQERDPTNIILIPMHMKDTHYYVFIAVRNVWWSFHKTVLQERRRYK
jgi:hypothetical protein